jgi:hypothetical protein
MRTPHSINPHSVAAATAACASANNTMGPPNTIGDVSVTSANVKKSNTSPHHVSVPAFTNTATTLGCHGLTTNNNVARNPAIILPPPPTFIPHLHAGNAHHANNPMQDYFMVAMAHASQIMAQNQIDMMNLVANQALASYSYKSKRGSANFPAETLK